MIEISHAGVSIRLDENDGGRAISWRVDEHELLGAQSAHPIDHGMYPMAPWAGRIRGNSVALGRERFAFAENFAPWAIHGTVLSAPFTVIDQASNRLVLEREIGEQWPYAGGVRCTWSLGDAGLDTTLEIRSHAEPFPAVAGWHPWFLRAVAGSAGEWSTNCTELLERGPDSLPTGERARFDAGRGPFDDALTGGTRVTLDWNGALRLEVENSHPWFVIYDATDDFICIEPQTGPPDGLSGAHAPVTLVTPDQPLVMRTTWRITRARPAG